MNTIAPPEIIPASAPCQFERLQKRANNTTGPNTAPKPAHAKETMPNTELFGSRAIKAAITAMASKVSSLLVSCLPFWQLCRRKGRKIRRRMQPKAVSLPWTL